ncbi:hypothetical protein PRIPAC_95573, partial [Pristionchus pacificus]|uniref:Uncharacterized protein n=1 Tax=Pristionchus pacificus TaxID=54126 RepID=A0A2A6BJZ2_PRIPA
SSTPFALVAMRFKIARKLKAVRACIFNLLGKWRLTSREFTNLLLSIHEFYANGGVIVEDNLTDQEKNILRFHGNTATIDFPEEIHQFLSDLLFAKKIFNGIELFRVEIYPLIPTDLNRRSFLHSIYVIEFKISRSVLDHLEELDLNDPKREEIDYWYRKYACETLVEYELTD